MYHRLANKCSMESDVQWTELSRMLETVDRFPLLMDRAANEVSWLCAQTKHGWRDTGGREWERERMRSCQSTDGHFFNQCDNKAPIISEKLLFKLKMDLIVLQIIYLSLEWICSIFDKGGLYSRVRWMTFSAIQDDLADCVCGQTEGRRDKDWRLFRMDGLKSIQITYVIWISFHYIAINIDWEMKKDL